MTSSILHPPAHLPPSAALHLSQQAPSILQNTPSAISSYSIQSLFSAAETADLWTSYENLMLSCLRTGDDQSAALCLERLTSRFGADNERLMAMKGLYEEATAADDAGLQKVLDGYNEILMEDPSNMPVSRRRIALLRSMSRIGEAVHMLNAFLETSPTDAEAWSELAELYVSQGLYGQAVFALEEVLLITPYAWNMHARLAEVQYISSQTSTGNTSDTAPDRALTDAARRFCRSVELCDDYLRGLYGLKLTTAQMLSMQPSKTPKATDEGQVPMDTQTLQKLNQMATSKLSEIVRRSVGGEAGWQGYDAAEVIAAKALLDKDASPVVR